MKIDLRSGEIHLLDNTPIRLLKARGTAIRCTRGQIWITLTGERDDIFLNPGQSWLITDNGLCLIEAVEQAQLHLEVAANPLVTKNSSANRHLVSWLERIRSPQVARS